MARKMVFISDVTEREVAPEELVNISLKFKDARRGVYVVDAHPDDDIVQMLIQAGHKQDRRGRKSTQPAGAVPS